MFYRSLAVSSVYARSASSGLVLAITVGLGVGAGAAVAYGRVEIALALAGALFGLTSMRYFPLVGWCLLLLLTSVAMRGVVTALGLPQSLNFLHYPVTLGFAVAALARPFRAASRAPAAWLLGLVLITVASMLANASHPLRATIFLIIAAEPLVIVWALARCEISDRDRRNIGVLVVLLAAAQFPIGALQAAGAGQLGDPVQGTLAGHGAGHHVLGGLFALALLVATAAIGARATPLGIGLIGAVASLAMMLATGSMAVTILTAPVVALVPVLAARFRTPMGARRRGPRLLAAMVIGVSLGMVGLFLVPVLVPSIYERARRLVTLEQLPELAALSDQADDPGKFVFGSGPGTTASRASLLLIPAEGRGSPLAFFRLDPTPEAREIASLTRDTYGGSAEAFRSSALAIIGDLGILGFAALMILFARIWHEASQSYDWLAPAAQAALMLSLLLIFVDNWLEYPEFAVPLALLVGIALSRRPQLDIP